MPGKPEDNPQGGNAEDDKLPNLKAQVAALSKKVIAMEVGGTSDGLIRAALSRRAACCRIKKHRHDNWLPKTQRNLRI